MTQTQPTAYCNGAYVPYEQAQLPLHDAGLVWGATITDRVRTFRQAPFRLAAHLQRFARSCALANVPLHVDEGTLATISHEVLRRNYALYGPQQEFSLVYLATPGPLANFAPTMTHREPTLVVYALPLHTSRFQTLWTHGASLRTELALLGCDPTIKHRSRLPWWIAGQKTQRLDPNAEPLFVTHAGEILETTTANFVAVSNGQLIIPPREQILGGISLEVVRELATQAQIPIVERPLHITELRTCSEAFLTNMSFCLASVTTIDTHHFPRRGPIVQQLIEGWNALTGTRLGAGEVANALPPC